MQAYIWYFNLYLTNMKVAKHSPLPTAGMAGLLRIYLLVVPVVNLIEYALISKLRPWGGFLCPANQNVSARLEIKASRFRSHENFWSLCLLTGLMPTTSINVQSTIHMRREFMRLSWKLQSTCLPHFRRQLLFLITKRLESLFSSKWKTLYCSQCRAIAGYTVNVPTAFGHHVH